MEKRRNEKKRVMEKRNRPQDMLRRLMDASDDFG
jgi:hypothetical protein